MIASHVFEHVANPLALLADVHRVLRDGGTLLLMLPDRHRTFDRDRTPTPLSHLIEEYRQEVDSVDDDHILEFLRSTGQPIAESPEELTASLTFQRERSIHAHVWDVDGFFYVVAHAVREMGQSWKLVDAVLPEDEGPSGLEFGWVFRRVPCTGGATSMAQRLTEDWESWVTERRAVHRAFASHSGHGDPDFELLRDQLHAEGGRAADVERKLTHVHRSRLRRLGSRFDHFVRGLRRSAPSDA